jgi:adenylate kinase
MKILMLGPPGVGKGTQAKKLSSSLSIPHISTGDLLREHIAKKTTLGIRAKKLMDQGKLVPHVIGMVQYRLDKRDCEAGYILDGYPRTVPQADELAEIPQFDVNIVLSLTAPDETIISRISQRRLCRDCGHIHHLSFAKPKIEGKCNSCSGKLYQRKDDLPESVVERLKIFSRDTKPLVSYYTKRGVLVDIDGSGNPDMVSGLIRKALDGWAIQTAKDLGRKA